MEESLRRKLYNPHRELDPEGLSFRGAYRFLTLRDLPPAKNHRLRLNLSRSGSRTRFCPFSPFHLFAVTSAHFRRYTRRVLPYQTAPVVPRLYHQSRSHLSMKVNNEAWKHGSVLSTRIQVRLPLLRYHLPAFLNFIMVGHTV